MNLQEIIESGHIELYAMNGLSETETAQMEAWATAFPEVRAEIEEAQAALELYAHAHAVEPSAGMKTKIMAAFDADFGSQPSGNTEQKEEHPSQEAVEKALDTPLNTPLSTTLETADSGFNLGKILPWTVAAMAVIVAIFGFWNVKNTQKELVNCQVESSQLVQKQQVIVDLEQKMNILRSPDTKTVPLNGLPLSKASKVIIYFNAKDKATLLSILDLPKPPKGKQYQLWAIAGKNPPVDAGVFAYDTTAIQTMKGFEKVDAFAITLENEGGSAVPTLDQMYVLGTL